MEDGPVSDVVYLYGFVPAGAPAPPAALVGLGGRPVELLPLGAVQAVVSSLPAGMYAGEQLTARLEDLAWVGEQGLAHERVVLWYVDEADIVPARLFTLYSSAAALEAALAADASAIASRLDALAGRREWNLKVAFDRARLAEHGAEVSEAVRTLDAELAAAPPGRRYLLERRRSELLKREVGAAARRLAEELLRGMAERAEAVRVLPLQAGEAGGNVVLTAALLVSREAEPAWRGAADELVDAHRALGMVVTLSGPWAPYRFLESAADA